MLLSLPAGECNTKPQQTGAMGACANLSAGATCVLADAPAGTPDDQLAVLQTQGDANGEGACQAKVWCSSAEADRAEYCATGEDPSTHCCKAKPPRCAPTSPDCSSSSSPATSLPTLLGLGAMLPLLAARRRRHKSGARLNRQTPLRRGFSFLLAAHSPRRQAPVLARAHHTRDAGRHIALHCILSPFSLHRQLILLANA